jgi:hypothetical protein
MCGIAGISLSPNDTTLDAAQLATDLLMGIASRGPDATGAAWYDADSDSVQLTKIAVNTTKFLAARQSIMPKQTPVMILHTRFATTGDKSNRANNHPIHYGSVIGVHNGVLWDHHGMFRDMKKEPLAQVDSEAIMALLDGAKAPEKVMRKIAGDAALAWIDLNDPEVLHLARVVDRPLHIAQTEGGSLLFASTAAAVEAAARNAKVKIVFRQEVAEAKYLKVKHGVIQEFLDIPGVQKRAGWADRYAWTSGGGSTYKSTKTVSVSTPKALPAGESAQKTTGPTGTSKAAVGKKGDATAAKSSTAETTWRRVLMSKHNDELVEMVKTNGSKFAEEELANRGIDKDGTVLELMTVPDLVEMVKQDNHPWARVQLSLRNLNAQGEPYRQHHSYIAPTVEELVRRAKTGDTFAVDVLFTKGLDRHGKDLIPAKTPDLTPAD